MIPISSQHSAINDESKIYTRNSLVLVMLATPIPGGAGGFGGPGLR
jgi:hypothetical protein